MEYKDVVLDFFISRGYEGTMLKKDARVLLKYKQDIQTNRYKLIDLIVREFKDKDQIDRQMYLYDEYGSDFGNCSDNWHEWTLVDTLISIFEDDIPRELKKKIYYELAQVEEWRLELAPWIMRLYQ